MERERPSLCVVSAAFGFPSAWRTIRATVSNNTMSSPLSFADIEDLPPAVQEKLFDDVLDRDVQKGTDDLVVFISGVNTHPHSVDAWLLVSCDS